eukprot:Hpha_TRINITY_DN15812_c0_g9::TRINITY_DN15812_c0_g9_i1::g.188716::m.188716
MAVRRWLAGLAGLAAGGALLLVQLSFAPLAHSGEGGTGQSSQAPEPPERSGVPPERSGVPPAGAGEDADKPRVDGFAWQGRADGTLESAGVSRMSISEARQCLAGRHVVFAGDSILRYTYMSLAHWLHVGEWPARSVQPWSNQFLSSGREAVAEMTERGEGEGQYDTAGANVAWQREWASWDAFFNGSSVRFRGAMCCDCHRHPKGQGGAPLPPFLKRLVDKWKAGTLPQNKVRSLQSMLRNKMGSYWHSQHENRFYSSPIANLSFFFLHGDDGGFGGPVGHRSGCPGALGGTIPPQALAAARADALKRPRWRGLWGALAAASVDAGPPVAVVTNVGRWKSEWYKDKSKLADNAANVERALSSAGGKPLFVTSTQTCTGKGWSHEELAGALKARGWGVVNAFGLTDALY